VVLFFCSPDIHRARPVVILTSPSLCSATWRHLPVLLRSELGQMAGLVHLLRYSYPARATHVTLSRIVWMTMLFLHEVPVTHVVLVLTEAEPQWNLRATNFCVDVVCPVCNVGVLWPNGWWIRMPLGKELGFAPGHIVLDGDPAPPHGKGHSSPHFRNLHRLCICINHGPCLLWPNGWMDQDSTWYGGRPWSK